MPKLLVEKGNNRNTVISIVQNKAVTAGRETDNDFQLHDIMASRKHFRIYRENSSYVIEDLNSSNGTFVNGKRITKQVLNVGDKVQVGDTLMSILGDKESQKAGGMIGKELGGYKIIERLGRGAMGTVFKAVQKSLDRIVALKILAPELLKNKDFINMFVKEARASGQLNHPNIIQVYDVGDFKGVWYFSMEYAEHGSVADKIENNQLVPVMEAIPMIIEACKGLEYAERKQIVHRDIKPDNLFIGAEHIVKLGDLGLAQKSGEKEEDEGVFGTPHYIAPEQAMGQNVDQRADIYSLGATFYRMVVGVTPFQGANVKEVLRKQVKEEPQEAMYVNPTVPKSINDIIHKMMEKDPSYRYQSATDVIKALEKAQKILSKPTARAAASMTVNSKPLSATKYVAPPKKSSNLPLVLGITAVVILAVVVAVAFALKSSGNSNGPERTKYTGDAGDTSDIGTINETSNNGSNTSTTDDDDSDDDHNRWVEDNPPNNNNNNDNTEDDHTKPSKETEGTIQDTFARRKYNNEIVNRMRKICNEKKLAQTSADDYDAIEDIAKAFVELAKEYKDIEVMKKYETLLPEEEANNLRVLIEKLKQQAKSVDNEFTTLQLTVNSLLEKEEFGKAYSELANFQKKFDNGAFAEYREFVIDKTDGEQNIEFSKVKQAKEKMSKIVDDLKKTFDEIEAAFNKGFDELKTLKEPAEIVEKIESLMKPYKEMLEKWAGITVYVTQAEERLKVLKVEFDKYSALLKKNASKAAGDFAFKLGPAIRDAFDYSSLYNFDEALKTLEALESLSEYKLCLEQAENDESTRRIVNVYNRSIEQIKYAKHFMKSFERDLNRANSIKITKPDFITDFEIVGDTITIKGYKDGKLEVKRSSKNLEVDLHRINGKSLFELMEEAMKLSKEKDPKILIGAGFVLMLKRLPHYAMKVFEKADTLTESKEEKNTIKEFLTYAIYDEVNRLNSKGDGIQARKLLERFKKEFSDTDAYKDIFDPPLKVPPSRSSDVNNNNNGRDF